MTKLTKIVTRETDVYERSDALVVSLHPRFLTIRLKGHREALSVPYDAILDLGRKLEWKRKAS